MRGRGSFFLLELYFNIVNYSHKNILYFPVFSRIRLRSSSWCLMFSTASAIWPATADKSRRWLLLNAPVILEFQTAINPSSLDDLSTGEIRTERAPERNFSGANGNADVSFATIPEGSDAAEAIIGADGGISAVPSGAARGS